MLVTLTSYGRRTHSHCLLANVRSKWFCMWRRLVRQISYPWPAFWNSETSLLWMWQTSTIMLPSFWLLFAEKTRRRLKLTEAIIHLFLSLSRIPTVGLSIFSNVAAVQILFSDRFPTRSSSSFFDGRAFSFVNHWYSISPELLRDPFMELFFNPKEFCAALRDF